MCGHGTIGVAATLAHLGRIQPGTHRFETPVGVVTVELADTGEVSFENVPSRRRLKDVVLSVPGIGSVVGDVAWGGNWFFLTNNAPCAVDPAHLEVLTDYAWRIRQALSAQGITGDNGSEIDHIEIFGDAKEAADSRNFVLCPGRSYDRSPCGTGTSAKLACLYADGKLREGEIYRQAGILGTVFEGWVTVRDDVVHPHIKGKAFINSEAYLVLDHRDPFQWGIRF
jgi:4-hydroxyproline epimerase